VPIDIIRAFIEKGGAVMMPEPADLRSLLESPKESEEKDEPASE